MNEVIRVLLADEHRLLHEGIRAVLSDTAALTLVGEAAGPEEIVSLTQRLQPDVVLLGLNVAEPPLSEMFQQLQGCCPRVHLLVLLPDGEVPVQAILRAGASGWLPIVACPV